MEHFDDDFEYSTLHQFDVYLKAEEILDNVNMFLTYVDSRFEIEFTKLENDSFHSYLLPKNCVKHFWQIEFLYRENENHRESIYKIMLTLLEYSDSKPTFVDFLMNCYESGYYCSSIIYRIKTLLKREEKERRELEKRYIEREPFLLFINGNILNYDLIDINTIKTIQSEKLNSKKRRVLENHWFHRDMLQFIDNI